MSAPKRFLNGIASVASSDPLGQLPYLDPTKWVMYYEDFCGPFFDTATITSGTTNVNGFDFVLSTNVTGSIVTDTDAPNGCLSVVTTAADNESFKMTTTSPGWTMTSGKKFLMETRFEITATTVASNELFIGLATNQDTTNYFATDGSARTFDDGIGWYSIDADTDIDVICGENDVYDNVTVKATYVTATWYIMSLYYDGTDIYTWVDGADSGKLTPAQVPVSVVGPSIFYETGASEIHTLLVDYLFVAKER